MRVLTNALITCVLAALPVLTTKAQQTEYFWDKDPGVGKGQVLQQFTGSEITINMELDASELSSGIHQIGLRTLNDKNYSATCYRSFYVPAAEEKLGRIEYGWDEMPSAGQGTALEFEEGTVVDLSQELSVSGLAPGLHTLYLRALSTGHSSLVYTRSFYVPATPHQVEAIEYYFDTDPGIGSGTQVMASLTGDELEKAFSVDTDGLTAGIHQLGIRTLTDGTWSSTIVRQFLVIEPTDGYVTRIEYFWDNDDPGLGLADIVDQLVAGEEVSLDFELDMSMLKKGIHTLGLRAQSGAGIWSRVVYSGDIDYNGILGDVNNDGIINVVDVTWIICYTLGKSPKGFNEAVADVNEDGIINHLDAKAISNRIMSKLE